jgi:3-hydroxyisobutyrate dehydrogenase-like beta-hydroxyacid dehydrogenase
MMMHVGFLGFGEVARAFRDSLAGQGISFSAHDILLGDDARAEPMRAAMRDRQVTIADTPAGLRDADWVVSAVTADQSLIAVRSLLPHLVQGQVVIDLNSVSPGRKQETAGAVTAAGGSYLDMAVMAPVHPRGHKTPVLLAGEQAEALWGKMAALGFTGRVVGDRAGAATAIKMVRSVFVKGLEAITVEALLAAEASGCFEEIFASLSSSYPGLDLSKTAAYQFERTLKHGVRRAAEMRESAATLDALGLRGGIAVQTAEIQQRLGEAGKSVNAHEQDLRELVRAVLALRLAEEGEHRGR